MNKLPPLLETGQSPDYGQTPVTVLTGFLGSGKTTLLNRLLSEPGMDGIAVVVNEFGSVGLDHDLIDHRQEAMVLLSNGCICCTIRSDLVEAFDRLATHPLALQGKLHHVVLETTGLADPAPILHTLMGDLRIAKRWRLAGVACTIDAFNGMETLDQQPESIKQAAVADLLLVTKTDLVKQISLAQIVHRLQGINPLADVAVSPEITVHELLKLVSRAPVKEAEVRKPDYLPLTSRAANFAASPSSHHDDHIRAYTIIRDEPLPREGFFAWLDLVASMRGNDLLRVKGIVHLENEPDQPTVIHGVQHLFHPPQILEKWPSEDRRTRIVFITRDIDIASLEETLNVMVRRRRRTTSGANISQP